jgi:hypothetical protein
MRRQERELQFKRNREVSPAPPEQLEKQPVAVWLDFMCESGAESRKSALERLPLWDNRLTQDLPAVLQVAT